MDDDFFYLFAATVLIATALALVAIWSPRRPLAKLGALVLAALLMPAAYASFTELLGRPKPVDMEWFRAAGADPSVLGSHLREGEAIYLWVQFEPGAEPAAYKLPWDEERAKELRAAERQSGETGRGVRYRWPNRTGSMEGEPMFYEEPQPALPPKQGSEGR